MTDREIITSKGTRYILDNQPATEAAYRARYPLPEIGEGIPGGTPLTGWPLQSDALAIHSSQKAEHEALCRKYHLPETQVRGDGRVVFRDRAHRKAYCKAFGFIDRDAGFSDAA